MKPRRWFRFSLRTIFVLIAFFGIALAWVHAQFQWIAERQQAREWLKSNEFLVITNCGPMPGPWSIRLFGERGAAEIVAADDYAKAGPYSEDKMKRLFPEARVRYVPYRRKHSDSEK